MGAQHNTAEQEAESVMARVSSLSAALSCDFQGLEQWLDERRADDIIRAAEDAEPERVAQLNCLIAQAGVFSSAEEVAEAIRDSAILVREVLAQKDLHISMFRRGFVEVSPNAGLDALRERERAASIALRIKEEEHNCCAEDLGTLRKAANALLHQIDIGDFVDSSGHNAKMLKAVHDMRQMCLRVNFDRDEG